MTTRSSTTKEALEPCPLNHHVSAGLRVNKTDPRIHCLDCGLSIAATDWFTLYERWNSRPSAPVVGSVAAGQSNIVFIDREAAASRAETAWTLTTHLGRPDESAMYQYACEVAARLIREMKPVPATVCRDERETFKEAIKWAKKVQAVKLDAARNAASDDEFAAMRLLSEANGAERVVETLEAALEASVSAPIVAPSVVNLEAWTSIDTWLRENPKATAAECLAELVKRIKVESAPASTVAPQQSERPREIFDAGFAVGHAQNPNAFCLACNEHPCNLIAVPAPPAALRDEAGPRSCVKCGHFEGIDPRGRCISVSYDAGGSLVYCGCQCEFKPATTPPSTLAKAAAKEIIEMFAENNVVTGTQVATIIERCLAGGGESGQSDAS